MLEHPKVLVAGDGMFLVDRLKDMLRHGWEPQLVHEVADALVTAVGSDLGDFRTRWPSSAEDLVEIALTLHRLPEMGVAHTLVAAWRELIAFLGRIDQPDDEEARWLLPTLEDDTLRQKTLSAMIGSQGWFSRLNGHRSPVIAHKMRCDRR